MHDQTPDYDDMTIADVMSADELYEQDRSIEFALDAADDARNTAAVDADADRDR